MESFSPLLIDHLCFNWPSIYHTVYMWKELANFIRKLGVNIECHLQGHYSRRLRPVITDQVSWAIGKGGACMAILHIEASLQNMPTAEPQIFRADIVLMVFSRQQSNRNDYCTCF